jgi:hypothetical protein
MPAMNSKYWFLEGRVARLHLPGLSLAFHADHPAVGLAEIAVAGRPWPGGRLMGIIGSIQSATTTTLADWHVRGDDLIAVYETGLPDAARVDLLWQPSRPATHDPWFARIDLLVSVRTDRLEWRHDVRLESVLPEAAEIENFDSTGNMFTTGDWSLALMVHPADLVRRELTAEAAAPAVCHLRQQLFRTESLEKGVILRARARAWFLPSGVDSSRLAACFADFAAADPPVGI